MIAGLLPVIGTLLERVLPDPGAQAEAKIKLLELAQRGELAALEAETKLAMGQIEVNRAEAATDPFRGGWRPATGWVCVAGLVYQFLLQPLLPWLVALTGANVPPLPPIDGDGLMILLTGLLGLGGLRSVEKIKGVR